jgi:hypothetical protein
MNGRRIRDSLKKQNRKESEMALIRNILFLTFEDIDTPAEKERIRNIFIKQNYHMIAETKIERTGIVKEWILESPVQYGKFNVDVPLPEEKKVFAFDPTGGAKKR